MQVNVIPVTPFEQNCSLLICPETKKAAIVDPGGDVDKILSQVKQHGVEVEKIFLTHGHMDHVGGTEALAAVLKVSIEGPHIADKFWLDQLPMQGQMFGFPEVPPFEPQRWLEHGDTITFGNQELAVLHTPGHTPGHVVFNHAETKQVIVGDVLFSGSIGRTDFPQGCFNTLMTAIKSQLWTLPEETVFFPGHGPTSTIGHEKRTNPHVR
ncbi:MBL fold metallo-hydrolase [Moritella dasanensis]|uniref:MBL fold metallo-hydrolase n=1 Tax=Moritella dasanensis TaxID=428031 RepID=UPI0002EA8AFC|nr:MBL fold metallo-hydrolase [Moritella dasanensis]